MVGAGLLALACVAGAQPAPRVQPDVARLTLNIGGKPTEVVTHLYKPAGDGPFPLVIFSHGRAGARIDRVKLQYPVAVGHANYWLNKGVAVMAPVRPGYGDTGGTDREDSHANWSGNLCTGNPDFTTSAGNARETVVAAYQWALQQPWVRKDRILLEGQSVGGMTTVATGALNLPGVVGFVNFAGGSGGYPEVSPGKSCKPGNLTETYRAYGQLAKEPSLWLYAENDLYWGAEAPRQWHEAFKAGGSDTELVQTGPVEGRDGHQLLIYGGKMWSGPLNAFVKKVGLLSP
nr:dipeptidyl aminopeptidase [Variovorax terrae]